LDVGLRLGIEEAFSFLFLGKIAKAFTTLKTARRAWEDEKLTLD